VAGGVHRRQANRWAEKDQQAQAQQQAVYEQGVADARAAQAAAPPPAAAPAAAPAAEDPIAQIEKLGKLKEQGLLTEEEFAAQKAKILGL
jgi:3-oxoacyl-ACP reductase-like protein